MNIYDYYELKSEKEYLNLSIEDINSNHQSFTSVVKSASRCGISFGTEGIIGDGISSTIESILNSIASVIKKIVAYIKRIIYKVFVKSLYKQTIRRFETPSDLKYKGISDPYKIYTNEYTSDDKKRFMRYMIGLRCFCLIGIKNNKWQISRVLDDIDSYVSDIEKKDISNYVRTIYNLSDVQKQNMIITSFFKDIKDAVDYYINEPNDNRFRLMAGPLDPETVRKLKEKDDTRYDLFDKIDETTLSLMGGVFADVGDTYKKVIEQPSGTFDSKSDGVPKFINRVHKSLDKLNKIADDLNNYNLKDTEIIDNNSDVRLAAFKLYSMYIQNSVNVLSSAIHMILMYTYSFMKYKPSNYAVNEEDSIGKAEDSEKTYFENKTRQK